MKRYSSKWISALREVLNLPAFSNDAVYVYLEALHEFDDSTVEHALRAWARHKMHQGFPSTADLRALIESTSNASHNLADPPHHASLPAPEAAPCP